MKKYICNMISVKSEEDFNKVKINYNYKQKILIHCQECNIPVIKILGRVISKSFDKLYCRRCSIINCTYDKYGVINVFQLKETKDKIKETCKIKFGTEYASQSETFKKTMRENNLVKYGVEYVTQTDNMKEKSLNTRLNNNNGNYKSKEEIEKIKTTFKDKYGCYGNLGRPEIKEKSDKTQELIYNTRFIHSDEYKKIMKERYGEINPDYIPECLSKMHCRYVYDNKKFDSSWELAYYIWLKDHNINFEFHKNLSFIYEFEGIEHRYWTDFVIEDNNIVEIKNPILLERMKIENTLENAKYKCMQDNNVKIITDVTVYMEYIRDKFGTIKYLSRFKNHK